MFRRLLSTYPKYTVYSSQHAPKTQPLKEYGFKREIVPSDFKYEKPKEKDKPKDKIWEGWIP